MPDNSEDVRMVTSMARFDRDLTLVDFGDDWAKIISRVVKIPLERIVRGASLPEIAGDEGRYWVGRYQDALKVPSRPAGRGGRRASGRLCYQLGSVCASAHPG